MNPIIPEGTGPKSQPLTPTISVNAGRGAKTSKRSSNLLMGLSEWDEDRITALLEKYKAPVFTGIILLALLILGGSLWKSQNEKKLQETQDRVHQFETKDLVDYKKGPDSPETAAAFTKSFNDLKASVSNVEGLLPLSLKVSSALKEKKKYSEALSILAPLKDKLKGQPIPNYFLTTNLAALEEDLGQPKEAIAHLESLIGSNVKLLEAKIYLDLGRLYLQTKEVEKAKANLTHVIEKFPNDSLAPVARAYLRQTTTSTTSGQ